MPNNTTQIICPNCGTEIDVNALLSHQLEAVIKKKYHDELRLSQKTLAEKERTIDDVLKKIDEDKKAAEKAFDERLEAAAKERSKALEESLKQKISEEHAELIATYQKELAEQSQKIQILNTKEAEIHKLTREKSEMKTALEAENLKKLNEQLSLERDKISKQAHDEAELAIKALQKQLEDQKKLTEEMKRKQEQGSMQLQGEVQELAIEEWLAQKFPLDTIDEIKKGVRGGDCVQIVNTREVQNCGMIYYESKRTKEFQPLWIEKFKNDIREKGADIGVLVTEVMPLDMERMGIREGVWICTFEEFKGLSAVLRHSLIQFNTLLHVKENKGDKMELLYNFLTSNEFKMRIEGIVEGFTQMKEDLFKEQRAMKRIWNQREKQIEKVVDNTIAMYGSIKGIAGKAILEIETLELDSTYQLDFDEGE